MSMFSCTHCDAQQSKWAGRCGECGSWGTLVEGGSERTKPSRSVSKARATVVDFAHPEKERATHRPTQIAELDRVLGGGVVPGSVLLLAGEPGIGKSTLIGHMAKSSSSRLLISSGEESPSQIRLRLDRLAVPMDRVAMIEETTVEAIATAIETLSPALVVVDSIQTASTLEVDGLPGSPSQVRASAVKLVELAKRSGCAILIVGQVTKDGSVAGPKMLEHLVDVVLSMEGEASTAYRILRAAKNRFGTTDEVGIFEMTSAGLTGVANPSERFLAERQVGPGSVVTCLMEGNRPFLVEVQALVDKTSFGYPVRRASGFDLNRLQLLIAIANRFAGAELDQKDVYVNIVGGLRAEEPAVDLAVLTALLSARNGTSFPDAIVLGEVGLSGEVRSIPFIDRRLAEASRFGMKTAIIPQTKAVADAGLTIRTVRHVTEIAKTYSK